jgi:hypothetical protein
VRGANPAYGPRRIKSKPGRNEMIVARIMLAALVMMACPSASMAQQGTPQEQAACRPDTRRLCRDLVGNDMAVLSCLQQNRAKLSRACREVLERHGR